MLSCIAPSVAGRFGWLQSQRALFWVLLLFGGAVASTQAQISRPYWFDQPLDWVGDTQPSSEETNALSAALSSGTQNSSEVQAANLETFIQAYPHCAWTPSLRVNLGKYYREHGQYTLALTHWDAAWQATKALESGAGKRDADYAIAQWTRLMASLGRLEMLNVTFQELAGRQFKNGAMQQMMNRTREIYAHMRQDPDGSYRCGLLALNNVAQALRGTNFDSAALMGFRSPGDAFSLNALAQVSAQFSLNLVPVKRGQDQTLVAPSVVHWRQNHFAAILAQDGDHYQVVDPTLGPPKWLSAAAINSEASGNFMVASNQIPASWNQLSEANASAVMGHGYPYILNDDLDSHGGGCPPPPGHGDGCASCARSPGMAAWRVSEPWINTWLEDTPWQYVPALGERVAFNLFYKQRDEVTGIDPTIFGFGAGWNSDWLSYVRVDSTEFLRYNQITVNAYLPGGGIAFFSYDRNLNPGQTIVTNYENNSQLSYSLNTSGQVSAFFIRYADGTQYTYDFFRTDSSGNWSYVFLTKKTDSQGFETKFNYVLGANSDESKPVVRLTSVMDADGRTNTLKYVIAAINTDNNLVSQVTDPYGHSASITYNGNDQIQTITDAVQLASTITYGSYGPDTLTTPYGVTRFAYNDNSEGPLGRAVYITEPDGGRQIYAYFGYCGRVGYGLPSIFWMPTSYATSLVPSGNSLFQFDNTPHYRDSFYWNPNQSSGVPDLNAAALDSNQFNSLRLQCNKARLRHWLCESNLKDPVMPSDTLAFERDPSSDANGSVEGQLIWYGYANQTEGTAYPGSQIQPAVIARILPDGSVQYASYQYNQWGLPLSKTDTYGTGNPAPTRTRNYLYSADGLDLTTEYGPNYEQLAAYSYNARHQMLSKTVYADAATHYTTAWEYDTLFRRSKRTDPTGLISSYTYYANTGLANYNSYKLSSIVNKTASGIPISTNAYSWQNGYPLTHTDARGLTTTLSFDGIGRLTQVNFPDGNPIQYSYSLQAGYGFNTSANPIPILDLTGIQDRLGNWTRYGYDRLRRIIVKNDALNHAWRYGYCGCGALDQIDNPIGQSTTFDFDNNGRNTDIHFPNTDTVHFDYDALGRISQVTDALGSHTLQYNNQGLLLSVRNAFGLEQGIGYNIYDFPTSETNVNGVIVNQTFDWLGRTLTRTHPGSSGENFAYSAAGVSVYTDPLLVQTSYFYDDAGRKIEEIRASNTAAATTIDYYYTPAGDLMSLDDGKNHNTSWGYDLYGRVTDKQDDTGWPIFSYKHDAMGRLTNAWSKANGYTTNIFDAAGNLKTVINPNATIQYTYDSVNRLQTMADALGTTTFTYDSDGFLQTEGGLWANDTVTLAHNNGLRTSLSLQGLSQTYGYDSARRLKTLTASTGTFTYQYPAAGNTLPQTSFLPVELDFPGGAGVIANIYDSHARLTSTILSKGSTTLNKHAYQYNDAGQRTSMTTMAGTANYLYDALGQLTNSSWPESWGYQYDLAGNLNLRSGPNQTNDIRRAFKFDSENQLTEIVMDNGSGATKSNFIYDGLNRRRVRTEAAWQTQTGVWVTNQTVRYLYDGNRVIQERDGNNNILVTYTRGLDLSETLEGAGGIGGLLARTDSGVNSYFHADGNGNVTALFNASGSLVAQYRYAPFGTIMSLSGSMANANLYRFSSKEFHANSGLYNFGYRLYDPNAQRFVSRDPIEEWGGLNLYAFVGNDPINWIDYMGLQAGGARPVEAEPPPSQQLPRQWGPRCMPEEELDKTLKELERSGAWGKIQSISAGPSTAPARPAAVSRPPSAPPPPPSSGSVQNAPPTVVCGCPAGGGAGSEGTALTKFYPGNNGVSGATERTFLMPGQRIDRYGGSGYSRFFSPQGTPDWARSLPPGTAGQPLRTFEVVKPFEVESGTVAPWFNQPGGGLQYRTPVNLDTLLIRGIIKGVTP